MGTIPAFLWQTWIGLRGLNDKLFKEINFTHYIEITDQSEVALLLFN